ncbi:MAG: RDD family protein [Candidatus Thorarchaeota archaeon]
MSIKFCPKCGNELEPNATFCPFCGTDLGIEEEEIKIDSTKVEYAGFWNRFIALIIDTIIISLIGSTISLIIFVSWIPFNIFDPLGGWWTVSFPFDWLLGFLYYWGLEAGKNGQTVGKMAMKIRTVDENTLSLSSSRNYAINNIFKSSPFLIIDFLIGIIKNSGDSKRRIRVMQNISETVVITAKEE